MLAVFLINLILSFVDRAVLGAEVVEPLSTIWGLATLIPSLALLIRRLHDIDRSGWWIVAPTVLCILAALAVTSSFTMGTPLALVAIPVIAALAFTVVFIVWYCQQGEPRPNRFE